jgi:hypothetical protein
LLVGSTIRAIIPEHRITDGIKTQAVIHHADRRIQQPRTGRHGPAGPGHCIGDRRLLGRWPPIGNLGQPGYSAGHFQIEYFLQPINQLAGTLQQNAQLSIRSG